MSLDVYLEEIKPTEVYWANITHNLTKMANAVGLYEPLWHPERIGVSKAIELVPLLREGLNRLMTQKTECEKLNPPNGWGNYEALVNFTKEYLAACEKHPEATIRVSV